MKCHLVLYFRRDSIQVEIFGIRLLDLLLRFPSECLMYKVSGVLTFNPGIQRFTDLTRSGFGTKYSSYTSECTLALSALLLVAWRRPFPSSVCIIAMTSAVPLIVVV